jgi:LmbE family N-acetylglucosaminyl deacetylase
MVKNKILAIVPRAADVALTYGATLLKYAKNDWRIMICVATSENREIEKKELSQSGKLLGIFQAYFLKYKAGSLKQAGLDNPKEDILQVITEEKPNIILTVARHGFSTNPDAVATSLATTLAYEKYCKLHAPNISTPPINSLPPVVSDPSITPPRIIPPKFYYYCLPEQFLKFVQSKGFLRKDSSGFNFEGTPDKKITHVIDVKNFVKQKIEALRMHKSAQIETSRMIELLKTYKSSHMDYFMKYPLVETDKIASRL